MNPNILNEESSHDGLYECPECGLHYRDAALAQECAERCGGTKSCSNEVNARAVECETEADDEQ